MKNLYEITVLSEVLGHILLFLVKMFLYRKFFHSFENILKDFDQIYK